MEVKMKKYTKVKPTTKSKVTGEVIKGEDEFLIDLVWKLCNIVLRIGRPLWFFHYMKLQVGKQSIK